MILCHDVQEMGLVFHNTAGLDSEFGLIARNEVPKRKEVYLEIPNAEKVVQRSHTERCGCG